MTCGIYKISSPSGKFYIGSAANVQKRWNQHRHLLKRGRHHSPPLQSAWIKYGGNLKWEIINECDVDDLIEQEQKFIDELNPEYNILKVAGRVSGYKHTDETRKFLRMVNLGRVQPEEQRRKIGEATKRRFADPEAREAIARANRGKIVSEETRSRMADARRAAMKDPERLKAARIRMSGENNPVAKLNWEIVRAIRKDFILGSVTQKSLCIKYGVSPASMNHIVRGLIWKENDV